MLAAAPVAWGQVNSTQWVPVRYDVCERGQGFPIPEKINYFSFFNNFLALQGVKSACIHVILCKSKSTKHLQIHYSSNPSPLHH